MEWKDGKSFRLVAFVFMLIFLAMITGCTEKYDDKKILGLMVDASSDLLEEQQKIIVSVKLLDINGIEKHGGFLNRDSDKYLSMLDQYKPSPEIEPAVDEFKDALRDYSKAGALFESGAKNTDISEIKLANFYMEMGDAHVKIVIRKLPDDAIQKKN